MRTPLIAALAMLIGGCALIQQGTEKYPRAPGGWQPYCFPASVAFLPGTDELSPGTRFWMPTMYENLSLQPWLYLRVHAGGDGGGVAGPDLADKRAQAVLGLLEGLGASRRKIEVFIDRRGEIHRRQDHAALGESESPLAVEEAAYVSSMIPPEEVERQRVQYEEKGIVVC